MKKLLICALLLVFALCVAACDGVSVEIPTEAPTEAPAQTPADTSAEDVTEAPTEESTNGATEAPTEESTEAPTEAPTEETPTVEPTVMFTAEEIADLEAINATVVMEEGYVHYWTGTADTVTNPSITLTAEGEGFTDIIAIKYRTNCGTYGSNYWGTFLLNGTAEFQGNRRDSDNWFFYYTDGEWDVLILDMRKNMAGSEGTPDTDVTGGAPIQSLVYNFFDYVGNDGKLTTNDYGEEYIDIAFIAFFESKEDAEIFAEANMD